jgi:hypothetical protein
MDKAAAADRNMVSILDLMRWNGKTTEKFRLLLLVSAADGLMALWSPARTVKGLLQR